MKRSVRAACVVVGALAAGAAACSLLVTPEDLSGARPPAEPLDAAYDATPPDASADADADVDTGVPPTWCQTLTPRPRYCDDFDQGLVDARPLALSNGGDAALDDAYFVSPPRSLFLATPVLYEGGSGALLRRALAGADGGGVSQLSASFWMRLDYYDSTSVKAELAQITLSGGGSNPFVVTFDLLEPNVFRLVVREPKPDASPGVTIIPLAPVAYSRLWTQITITMTLPDPTADGSSGALAIFFNGVEEAALPVTNPLASGVATLSLGPGVEALPSNYVQVSFDNVTFNAE